MKGWLETLWEQVFRDERVTPPGWFLRSNLSIGLFASIVLYAGARHPERMNVAFAALVACTVATHVGGALIALAARRAVPTLIFVHGVVLLATTASFVATCLWLTVHATTLSNVRYLPGVALALFVYASLELRFFGPRPIRAMNLRRLGIILGIASELALATTLVRVLLRS